MPEWYVFLISFLFYINYKNTFQYLVDGHCFTWGCGRDGALGLGHRDDIYVPFLVKYFVDRNIVIKKIAAGYSNSAAIDINGNLYTWYFHSLHYFLCQTWF